MNAAQITLYSLLGIKISPGETPREIVRQKFGGVAGVWFIKICKILLTKELGPYII